MRIIAIMACALALSGCSLNLEQLRALNPEANDFESALAAEYQAYAESEAEQGRLARADYFAGKGLAVLNGETVLPDMPPENLPELAAARQGLVAALTEDVKHVIPQVAARTQLLFDCWLEQTKTPVDEKAPCGEEFKSTISQVQEVADWFVYGQETTHIIHFAEGSSALDERAQAIIAEVAARMKRIQNYAIELDDRSMPKTAAARRLSKARALAVRDAFAKLGIKRSHLKQKDRQEDKQVILSSDVRERNALEITVRTEGMPGGHK